ncbi:hypothetical protein [Autumnicola musiva]|uniref:Uncharacterized protein n=1 Tax=Autumnicola musiva TaxID=3075589 RepID=A0ABU3D2L3_9FLAO|nr:hypothetical protein [Zunongwangia sp. F117]MDT0675767.1 hypothetical protein [Zunongwangia sp. F117]
MKNLIILSFLIILVTSCKNENSTKTSSSASSENASIAEEIAKANGLENFKEMKEVDFTFNVRVQDTIRSQRSWQWNPQTNEIRLTENDISQTYTRDGDLSEDEKKIDQKFINDTYWLLFPYQLVWSNAEISEEKNATTPISGKQMDKLTVAYTDEGGYTPGDSYDIYYNDDLMLQEWVYKAADGNREMATTWEDYQDFNGVKIAKSHKSADGNFELFFSDVSLQ